MCIFKYDIQIPHNNNLNTSNFTITNEYNDTFSMYLYVTNIKFRKLIFCVYGYKLFLNFNSFKNKYIYVKENIFLFSSTQEFIEYTNVELQEFQLNYRN